MQNPLVIFVGAAVATLAALLGVTYDKWSPEQAAATGIVAPASQPDTAAAPSAGTTETATSTTATPAPSTASSTPEAGSTELAAIDPQAATAPSPEASAGQETAIDDSIPTFDTIRVETDGSAVMAGRGLPSADVTVMLDGQPIGTTKIDSGGAWVFVPEEPLPAGDHDLTLRMEMASESPVHSQQSVALKVPEHGGDEALVVLNDPNQASKVLQKPPVAEVGQETAQSAAPAAGEEVEVAAATPSTGESATVPLKSADTPLTLNTVDYNDAGDIIFSGSAPAGSSVRLYVDNKSVGDAKVDATGAWTFAGRSQIRPGTHSLRVDQLGNGAKVAQRIELPFVRAEPQEVAALMQSTTQPTPAAEQPPAAATDTQVTAGTQATETQTAAAATASDPQTPEPEASSTMASTSPAPATTVEPVQPADSPPSDTAAITSEELAPAEIPDTAATEPVPQPAAPASSTETAASAPAPVQQQATAATEPSSQSSASAPAAAATPEVAAAAPEATAAAAAPEATAAAAAPEATDAAPESPTADTTAATSIPAADDMATNQPATAPETVASSAPAAPGQSATEFASRNGRVVIQPGNNLWRISRVIYGQGVQYTIIYQANKDQIRNPHLIYPGQIFATPGVSGPEKIDPEQRAPLESESGGTTSG